MKKYLGIDLGGTSVRIGKVDEQGNIIQDVKAPSCALDGPKAIEDNILNLLKQFDLSDCQSIGFGIPGPVDALTNTITIDTNIPGCKGYPFAQDLTSATNLPVFLDNDANAAGLAEAILGAGKGYNVVYYLTHSTGIGGALIVNSKIVSGFKGYTGEVGNMIIDPTMQKNEYFKELTKGSLESIASGTALGFYGKEVFGENGDEAYKVFDLAKQNNADALKLVDDMSKRFATALANIASIVGPDCFVIGGGCSNASDIYFPLVKKYYDSLVHDVLTNIPIKKAVLKEPGLVGAAMIGKSKLEK